jgi:tetratricopeptide (TPR) repeat protein
MRSPLKWFLLSLAFGFPLASGWSGGGEVLPTLAQSPAEQVRQQSLPAPSEADRLLQQDREHGQSSQLRESLQFWEEALTFHQEVSDRAPEAQAFTNIGSVNRFNGYKFAVLTPKVVPKESKQSKHKELSHESIPAIFFDNKYEIKAEIPLLTFTLRKQLLDNRNLRKDAERLFRRGVKHFDGNEYSEALQVWEQSLQVYSNIGDVISQGRVLLKIAATYEILARYPDALLNYQSALAMFEQGESIKDKAAALSGLGLIYLRLGEYAVALTHYEQSLELRRDIRDLPGEAITLSGMGVAYSRSGSYERALECHRRALDIRRETLDVAGQATSLYHIGFIHQKQGNYADAIDDHQQALSLYRAVNHRVGIERSLSSIADSYIALDQFSEALLILQEALSISREIGDCASEASALNSIGGVFEAQEQPELAIIFYKEAINIYEQIRNFSITAGKAVDV